MEFELCVLRFVASLRTADFKQYQESLTYLVTWFFALDQTNYSRWLSVHIRDMASLSQAHPEIYQQFQSGAFVAMKTKRAFSGIATGPCT